MEKIFTYLGIMFCIIWIILSILSGAVANSERKETKDGSWKIFGAIFFFCVANAIMYGILAYLL
jgi:hypothetical protein